MININFYNGEYFNAKDSQLFCPQSVETEFDFLVGYYKYKIKIEKCGENFKTMTFLVSPELGTVFLSAFFYDKKLQDL